MPVKVYSAAVGTLVMKGMTARDAWHECTEMFRDSNARSFMRGGWSIEHIAGGVERERVGSLYLCRTHIGPSRFVKLVSSDPPRSFAYLSIVISEPGRPRNYFALRQELDESPNRRRMEFSFESEASDTVVTIKRLEIDETSWWEDLTDKYGDLAAINLSFILTGKNVIASNVKRADHLRKDVTI